MRMVDLIEKKRGLGMFVKRGAQQILMEKRKAEFINQKLLSVLEEAQKLNITQEQLIQLIKGGYERWV